jgi:hypothetical protein
MNSYDFVLITAFIDKNFHEVMGDKCSEKFIVHDNVLIYHYFLFLLYSPKFQVTNPNLETFLGLS